MIHDWKYKISSVNLLMNQLVSKWKGSSSVPQRSCGVYSKYNVMNTFSWIITQNLNIQFRQSDQIEIYIIPVRMHRSVSYSLLRAPKSQITMSGESSFQHPLLGCGTSCQTTLNSQKICFNYVLNVNYLRAIQVE